MYFRYNKSLCGSYMEDINGKIWLLQVTKVVTVAAVLDIIRVIPVYQCLSKYILRLMTNLGSQFVLYGY